MLSAALLGRRPGSRPPARAGRLFFIFIPHFEQGPAGLATRPARAAHASGGSPAEDLEKFLSGLRRSTAGAP